MQPQPSRSNNNEFLKRIFLKLGITHVEVMIFFLFTAEDMKHAEFLYTSLTLSTAYFKFLLAGFTRIQLPSVVRSTFVITDKLL